MNTDQAIEWLRLRDAPIADTLDELVSSTHTLGAIRAIMEVHGLGLSQARMLVERRKFELEYPEDIAASAAWVAAKVAEVRTMSLEDATKVLREGPSSGRTPWEPSGLPERASVLSKAFDIPFGEAVDLVVGRRPA